MGKAIDKLKCGGKPGHKSGGKTKGYQKGGRKGDGPRKNILLPGTELTEHQSVVTMSDVQRVKRLRGHQGKLTHGFAKKYPKIPLSDILGEIAGREPHFSKRDVPQVGEELTGSFGDVFLEPEEITGILGDKDSKEYFDLVQSSSTAGEDEQAGPQRFGFRNMITPQYRGGPEDAGPYQYLESKPSTKFQTGGATRNISALTLDKIESIKGRLQSKDPSMGPEGVDQGVRTTYQPEQQNDLVTEGAAGVSGAIGAGTDAIEGIVSAVQDRGTEEFDPRVDPAAAMKKDAGFEVGKDILKSTGKGAAIGSTFGPIGTIIGAGAGLLTSGIKNIVGAKKRKEDREERSDEFEGFWADKYFRNREAGYEEGGKIKGPGTTKSDSITMKAKENAFIVPAENAKEGMRLGREYLGWTDESLASRNNGGSKIKVSKGEVFYTPEEAEKLQFIGVDLNKLAPNAKPGNKFANGTFLQTEDPMMADTGAKDLEEFEEKLLKTINPGTKKSAASNAVSSITSTPEEEIEAKNDRGLIDLFPEMASTAQILGAVAGLAQSGKIPDLKISSRLKKLAVDTREAATYGLEPNVRNAYMREIERTRRDVMNKIVSRGGSAGEIREALGQVTSTTLAKKAQIPVMEQDMIMKKREMNIDVEKNLASMVYDKSRVERQDWFAYQEAWGAMLQEGLKNFIGARQYKENLDYMKSVGGTSPSFTINTK